MTIGRLGQRSGRAGAENTSARIVSHRDAIRGLREVGGSIQFIGYDHSGSPLENRIGHDAGKKVFEES